MEEIPAPGGGCTWVRYINASFLKSDTPRCLAHLPRYNPVLQPGLLAALDLEGQSTSSCSETRDFAVVPELHVDRSLTPLLHNRDLELHESRCLETKNSQVLPEPEANRTSLKDPLPQPVHTSAYTKVPGFENFRSANTEAFDSDIVPQPDLTLSMKSLPSKQVCESGSPTAPCLEERVLSSSSEITDFEVVPGPEISRDIRLPRTTAEVEQGLEQDLFSPNCFSESSDSDILSESERKFWFLVQRPCNKVVNTSGVEIAPKLEQITIGSSESSDSDVFSDPEGQAIYYVTCSASLPSANNELALDLQQTETPFSYSDTQDSDVLSGHGKSSCHCEAEESVSVAANSSSGNEVASGLEQTEISVSYFDTKDSDVLSNYDNKSFHCEATETATVAINSSTGGGLVAEELKLREDVGKVSEGVAFAKLNPNAREFIPGAWNSGDFRVHSGQESDNRQRLKLNGEQLTLSWVEGNSYNPSAPSPPALDLGTALRVNHERTSKWTKWSKKNDFAPRSQSGESEVVWGSGQKAASTVGKSGPVQGLKLPSGNKNATPTRRGKDWWTTRTPSIFTTQSRSSGMDDKRKPSYSFGSS